MHLKESGRGIAVGKTDDFTTGNVSAKLLGFFFPMLLTNLLQQLYSIADTAVVGKGLGDYALGAVGNLAPLSLLIIGFSMGITGGLSVIIAQEYGAGDEESFRRSAALSIKLAGCLALILTAAGCLLLRPVLQLIRTDQMLLADSLKYGYILFGGLVTTTGYQMGAGILRSVGDSRTPLGAILFSSGVNIALDCVLIFGLHTGVEGAASATVISQGISAVLCFRAIRRIPCLKLRRQDFRKNRAMTLLLLKNGLPAACMHSVTAAGCMVVQGYINGYGAVFTTAYSVCSRYLNFFMLPAVTAGSAVSSFVSQNHGAGEMKRIRKGVQVCAGISLVSWLLLGPLMAFLPDLLASLMLNENKTVALSAGYLRICGYGLILLNLLFLCRSAVQGMGMPFVPMLSGFAEMALRIMVIPFLLPMIGFRAAACAEVIAWSAALTMNLMAYYRGMTSHT
jgi:putative MATE family efflux protein